MTTINSDVREFTGKAIAAKRAWCFIQSIEVPIGSPTLLPAFQTEGGVTYGGDNINEQTEMEHIIIKSTDEHSIELTQCFIPNGESIKVVEDTKKNGDSMKVQHIVTDESVTKVTDGLEGVKLYPAESSYGIPDDIKIQDGDDLVEASYTLNIIGELQEGEFPLSNADIVVIEALYDYRNPGETTGDFDRIQAVAAPKVGKATPANTGIKVELS